MRSSLAGDYDRVVALLQQIAGADARPVLAFHHDGVPVPKERARWSPRNQRMYTPDMTRDAEQALAWRFRAAFGRQQPLQDTVAIVTLFFVDSRTKRGSDGDNLQKVVLDALTKARAWVDDDQVKASTWLVELDERHPRTVIALCPYVCALMRAPLLTSSGAI